MDGGAGADGGIRRNWAALDAVEMAPRYGNVVAPPPAHTTLFGRPYAAPLGIAPIGGPGTAFPGAEKYFARAAQAARVPYTMGVLSGIDLDEAARIAPDVLWFQIYRFAKNDHRIGLDLVDRAAAAGVHVLVLTYDTPIRTVRSREVKSGIVTPFRLTTRLRMDAMMAPRWLRSLAANGIPRFVTLNKYMHPGASLVEASQFMQREGGGAFTWDEIARYRDRWKGPLVLKGVLHPEDAARAVALGLDGVQVSNHGGRQIEALPASIDALPSIVVRDRPPRQHHPRFRRALGRRRGTGDRAGRRRRLRRQGLPVVARRARGGRPGASDRRAEGRAVGHARPARLPDRAGTAHRAGAPPGRVAGGGHEAAHAGGAARDGLIPNRSGRDGRWRW